MTFEDLIAWQKAQEFALLPRQSAQGLRERPICRAAIPIAVGTASRARPSRSRQTSRVLSTLLKVFSINSRTASFIHHASRIAMLPSRSAPCRRLAGYLSFTHTLLCILTPEPSQL